VLPVPDAWPEKSRAVGTAWLDSRVRFDLPPESGLPPGIDLPHEFGAN
jgi:hypothetical protein